MSGSIYSWLLLPLALSAADSPEQRAIAFLAREIPAWSRDNGCFSCHNNGDGARALYAARRAHFEVPAAALADTTQWLMQPSGWDRNRGNPAASDKKLARIQFAAALAEATDDGAVLREAARSLLGYQEKDGSWQVDAGAEVGSPATWGPVLATDMVRRILEKADAALYRDAIARADAWLRAAKIASVPDAAVLLRMGRNEALDLIRRAQTSDGGWGPRANSPAEVFDTALVLLAIRDHAALVRGGRGFLIRTQLPSGGWPETTRPAGGQSYAQHISTSAWATLALLATRPER
jgi:Prenyltransferase and squalene oxidase repeat